MFTSNRWFIFAALLFSSALFLAVSSVIGNSVHILSKNNFVWYRFGSVSIELIVSSLFWTILVGCIFSVNIQISARNQLLSLCAVAAWTGLLLVFLAYSDAWITSWGVSVIFGVLYWVIEIAGAALLIAYIFRQSLSFIDLQSQALLVVMALIWLTATKAMFLCLSPGVSIRL